MTICSQERTTFRKLSSFQTRLYHCFIQEDSNLASGRQTVGSELLENIVDRSGELVIIKDEIESSVLGIQWNQTKDMIHFSYKPDIACDTVSKRIILSGAARLFDPLGLLGPIIVVAKLILQEL